MRKPRLKPRDIPMFYHLYNRVSGFPSDFPFGPREKAYFIRLLHKLSKLYTVEILSYQVMSNHFHLTAYAPAHPPSLQEAADRYTAYYQGKKSLDPSDPQCREIAERMRDISWFMKELQQQFSSWFNRTRPIRRRGTLWAGRFKHTLLGDAQAVWECSKYVQLNPVRAGMVADPGDYRFCSYGAWCGTGRHPLESHVRKRLLPFLQGLYPFESIQQLKEAMQGAFAQMNRTEHADTHDTGTSFRISLNRRVRYWVDGLLIGSDLFLHKMISSHPGILQRRKQRFSRASGMDTEPRPLYCYKRLAAI